MRLKIFEDLQKASLNQNLLILIRNFGYKI